MRVPTRVLVTTAAGFGLLCTASFGNQARPASDAASPQIENHRNAARPASEAGLSKSKIQNVKEVTNTNDSGPGSLRQAIADANSGDTIQFDPALIGQTINLTTAELLINKSLTIDGPGSNLLTIRRGQEFAEFRLFHIQGTATVLIEGLTITGGNSDKGGGIYNENNPGTLTITGCLVTNNQAATAGGGIAISNSGTTALSHCTISHNTTPTFGSGGGIESANSTLTITDSTISDNTATYGGGISCYLGPVRISNSTMSNNLSIGIFNSWTVEITNSTLSSSSIDDFGGILNITNTILNNSPIGNSSGEAFSHGYNISSDNGHGYLTGPGDQINTNPMLGPLQDNGGPTFTHALLPGSPAINTGDPNFTPPPSADQRGYPRVVNGRIDIGSFEVQPITISGTVSYCSDPEHGPVPSVTLTLTGGASGITLSNSSGNYMFSVAASGNYTVTPSTAPLTQDSFAINTIDVVAVQRHFLHIGTPLSGCRLLAADVNSDTLVNTIDVTAIQRFVLGLPTGLANVGNYQFTPPSHTYQQIVSNQVNQNYDTIIFGDVAMPYAH